MLTDLLQCNMNRGTLQQAAPTVGLCQAGGEPRKVRCRP
jgi:hypothetical protein